MNDAYTEPGRTAWLALAAYLLLLALVAVSAISRLDQLRGLENATPQQLDDAIESLRAVIDTLLILSVAQALLASLYLVSLARRTRSSGRFPPPGAAVLTRTRIVRDKQACRYACLSYLLAGVAWLPVFIPIYLQWLLDRLS